MFNNPVVINPEPSNFAGLAAGSCIIIRRMWGDKPAQRDEIAWLAYDIPEDSERRFVDLWVEDPSNGRAYYTKDYIANIVRFRRHPARDRESANSD